MKKKRLAVCDRDPLYASNLADYINRTTNMPCEAAAFTAMDSFEKYAACAKVDILLVNPELLEEKGAADDGGEVIASLTAADEDAVMAAGSVCEKRAAYGEQKYEVVYLVDEVSDVYHENAGYYASVNAARHKRINKYQAADRLLDDIRVICMQQEERADPSEETADGKAKVMPHGDIEKIRLLAVYSPIGRCGKTIFSVALGEAIAKTEKALYLNMESYPAFEREENLCGDLSDLIFDIRRGVTDLVPHMRNMVGTWQSLDYLPPVRTLNDLKEISCKEWMTLIAAAARCGYTAVVLDAGGQTGDIFEILLSCRKVYVPCMDDPVSQIKLDRFRENLRLCGMAELERKMEYLTLPQADKDELRDYPMRAVRGKIGTYVKKHLAAKCEASTNGWL